MPESQNNPSQPFDSATVVAKAAEEINGLACDENITCEMIERIIQRHHAEVYDRIEDAKLIIDRLFELAAAKDTRIAELEKELSSPSRLAVQAIIKAQQGRIDELEKAVERACALTNRMDELNGKLKVLCLMAKIHGFELSPDDNWKKERDAFDESVTALMEKKA